MVARASDQTGLVPVHCGVPNPEGGRLPEGLQYRPEDVRLDRIGGSLAEVSWSRAGVTPRWRGREASDCAAAIEPCVLAGKGAEELDRFLAGAAARREVALLVVSIGVGAGDEDDAEARMRRVASGGHDTSVRVSQRGFGSVLGRQLPSGPQITLAPGVTAADRDLGLRLLNGRDEDARWWALEPQQLFVDHRATGAQPLPLGGRLEPILVDGLGDTVAGVWVHDDDSQRWYILPAPVDWDQVAAWLVEQALPEFVPDALRRARAPHAQTPELETDAERTARQALSDLEKSYTEQKAALTAELEEARQAATPVRDGLLFSSGTVLEKAVAAVLGQAGFTVTALDEDLGDTTSADLLVEFDGSRRLVEVKSSGGGAPERLVSQLQRHLGTWPQLRPEQPVDGGVLVVNHHLKTDPAARPAEVYQRPEFVDSLTVEVIGARQLYDWWRTSDWAAIRTAVLGAPPPAPAGPSSGAPNPESTPVATGWWRRRRAGG